MALRFSRLTRPAIRKLTPGQQITEFGITARCLSDGDIRYTVAFMVDAQRIHRVIGRGSERVTRTQCEDFISKARSDSRDERLNLPQGRKNHLSFKDAAQMYLEKLHEIGGKDITNNEQHLRLHLIPYFGRMRFDQISVFTLQKFQNHCLGAGLTRSTTNRILSTYRRMGRQLFRWRVIPSQPPMVKLEAEKNARDIVISEPEKQRLLAAALEDSNNYIWLFIKLGLATGLRHSELVAARFENFDALRRRLRVRVKGGRWRKQPLTRSITEILKREREMAQDRDGWIFPSVRTSSGHIGQMTEPFARCAKSAGLDEHLLPLTR